MSTRGFIAFAAEVTLIGACTVTPGVGPAGRGTGDSTVDRTGGPTPTREESTSETGVTHGATAECSTIDFLFVVSGRESMQAAQDKLIAAFPIFFARLEQTLGSFSPRFLVVDGDGWECDPCEDPAPVPVPIGCPAGMDRCVPIGLPSWCSEHVCGSPAPTCTGPGSANRFQHELDGRSDARKPCTFQSDAAYFEANEPDLAASFACAASVGRRGGAADRILMSTARAVSMPGELAGCNGDWVRPGAALVVVLATDGADASSWWDPGGNPQRWHDAVTARPGDGASFAFALLPPPDLEGEPSCAGAVTPATPALTEFIDRFGTHSHRGSVCAPDFHEFFDSAAEVLGSACATGR